MKRLILLGAVLALIALACGDSDPVVESLPPATGAPSDSPDPISACLEGEPDCVDTFVAGDEPIDLPSDDGGSAGFVVDGGLTISDALDTNPTGVIAVKGFLVSDASGARLCEALAESMPPQCGEASIGLSDLSTIDPDEMKTAQGVTWTDQHVTVFGELVDGVLVVDALSL